MATGLLGLGAATAYQYAKDPEAGVGVAAGKATVDAADLASDVVKGATGKEPEQIAKDALNTVMPVDDRESSGRGNYAPWELDNYEKAKQERDVEYPQNESLKKKFTLNEQPTDFELELERHFPDPMVRKAIISKARRESNLRNAGEQSYRNTPNSRIRKVLPQLRHMSDSELNALKQDDKKFFDRAYSKVGGYQYRGRGPIQITGKANYELLDKQLGLNGALVKDPDLLLRDPKIANAASIQFLKNAGLDKYTPKDQREAHQKVIAAIGGAAYAAGTKRGNAELAQAERGTEPTFRTALKTPAAPSIDKLSGSANSPQEKIKQSIPAPGISVRDAINQASAELRARRTAAERPAPMSAPLNVAVGPSDNVKDLEFKGTQFVGRTDTGSPVAGGEVQKAPAPDQGSWDKFINTVTKGRVSPEEKEKIAVPESINREMEEILRLAGSDSTVKLEEGINKQAAKVIHKPVNTELKDILRLSGRYKK